MVLPLLQDARSAKPAGPRDPRLLALPLGKTAPDAVVTAWATAKDHDTPAMAEARAGAQREARNEYRRLLYVAMTRAVDRLVVCGTRGVQEPPEGCWYQLVEAALKAHCVSEPDDIGQGTVLRFYKQPRADEPAAVIAPAKPDMTAAYPSWLDMKVASDAIRLRRVAPSGAGDEHAVTEHPADVARKQALQRGTLIHRLLQSLPDIAADRRGEAARQFLARAARDLPPDERETIAAQAFGLMTDRRFAALFAPGSRAEVPLVGRMARAGGPTLAVSGVIDRLVVTTDDILIADYKTNRPPPRNLDETLTRFPGYVRQLALYRAVLAQLYPTKPLRAALIWTDVPDFMELSSEALDAALAQVTCA